MTAEDHGARLGTWLELVRRSRIHKDLKFACLVFASYASSDGAGIMCSRARLSVDLDVDLRTAERRLKWMRDSGLIEMTARGNRRRGLADTYRLTLVPDLSEKVLEAPDPEAYRKLIGQVSDANRRTNDRKYKRKKEREQADSTDTTSDGRTPVDNSSQAEGQPDPSTDTTSDGWTPFQPTESEFSTDRPNSLTCEDSTATSHVRTLHGQDNLPCGADTGRSPSYRPHAREAPTNPTHNGKMDDETARLVRAASQALHAALGEEGSARATQAIYDELGTDIGASRAVIEAAQRFTQRRTG